MVFGEYNTALRARADLERHFAYRAGYSTQVLNVMGRRDAFKLTINYNPAGTSDEEKVSLRIVFDEDGEKTRMTVVGKLERGIHSHDAVNRAKDLYDEVRAYGLAHGQYLGEEPANDGVLLERYTVTPIRQLLFSFA